MINCMQHPQENLSTLLQHAKFLLKKKSYNSLRIPLKYYFAY